MESGAKQETPAPGQPTAVRKLLGDLGKVALPLLLSGGGLLGFVAFTGGAVTWARFSANNLPAEQAIAATSKAELIATGAVSMTFFALLGLLAVLMTYLISEEGTPNQKMFFGVVALVVLESGVVLFLARGSHELTPMWEAAAAVLVAAVLTVGVIVLAGETMSEAGRADGPPDELTIATWGKALCAAIVLGAGFVSYRLTDKSDRVWVAACLLFAALLGLACLQVAHRARHFAWFGVAVFLSVPLFGTALGAGRTLAEPQLQPMALVRAGDGPAEGLQGIYVTENDERVYMASVAVKSCDNTDLVGDAVVCSG